MYESSYSNDRKHTKNRCSAVPIACAVSFALNDSQPSDNASNNFKNASLCRSNMRCETLEVIKCDVHRSWLGDMKNGRESLVTMHVGTQARRHAHRRTRTLTHIHTMLDNSD
jgi:hypothetical protein